jgi:hypothetical protein
MTVRATRLPIFLTCMALLLAQAVVSAAAAEAGSRTREQVPSELWKTYPLNPGGGRIDAGKQGTDESSPSTQTSTSNRRGTPDADEQGSVGDKTPWAMGLLAAVGLVVLGLVALLALRHFSVAAVVLGGQREGPGRRNSRSQFSVPRAEKGSTMDKWMRKARAHNSKRASKRAQAGAREVHEEMPPPAERVSEYLMTERAATENQAEASEGHLEETPAEVAPDAPAEISGTEGESGLTAVGEEVQAVLSSAQDAAAAIRRKAEEEAKRARSNAWATAKAEIAEAQRIAAGNREDAERIRAEAEAFAAEARVAAETLTEELRTSAEREAARIEEEARERLSAADADAKRKVERAEDEARERIGLLRGEIERHEERLENILVILGGMSSQIEDVLAARSPSGETADESLQDALRLDRSSDAGEAPAQGERAASVAAGENDDDPAHEKA